MYFEYYTDAAEALVRRIRENSFDDILAAASKMADSILKKRAVYLFGSGHSVIPCMDVFPRYGGYAGFVPMMDPRLMWTTPSGPGGTEEVIWLERVEGYAAVFLQHYHITADDTVVVFSHGGLNAAPVEVCLHAKKQGATLVAVTSKDNMKVNAAKHSSGKRTGDLADIVIDNCVGYEDAQVSVEGSPYRFGGVSTIASMIIAHSFVTETAKLLAKAGAAPVPFVSPNVPDIRPNHSAYVYEEYNALTKSL